MKKQHRKTFQLKINIQTNHELSIRESIRGSNSFYFLISTAPKIKPFAQGCIRVTKSKKHRLVISSDKNDNTGPKINICTCTQGGKLNVRPIMSVALSKAYLLVKSTMRGFNFVYGNNQLRSPGDALPVQFINDPLVVIS